MDPNIPLSPDIVTLGYDLLAFKVIALVSFLIVSESPDQRYYVGMAALLAYDYCLTIRQEIETIWKGNRSLGMKTTLWTAESSCNRFAIVEWIQTLLIVLPAEAVLVLRDTAYLGVSIFFDFTVFIFTICRTVNFSQIKLPTASLLRTILRDGAFYFLVILSGNIVWMVCSLTGRRGIKLINAQPSMLLTSIMITRLTLSLRSALSKDGTALPISWPRDIMYTNDELATTSHLPTTSTVSDFVIVSRSEEAVVERDNPA
ncbi:hypothetical protein JR316_0009861 [Psilocybe cubensis]|uniref:Uncharacterized protein n=1 Tax=Psilocybe cubensis TaxID=181762 RepID=A0ACB8GRK6_PSICU|nr:hypothetical protein JR316_0009861 [Psilocybe cubensis]KAH9477635.1 hypothetical protein JR316_0009861 [Psilocybe cubensis]